MPRRSIPFLRPCAPALLLAALTLALACQTAREEEPADAPADTTTPAAAPGGAMEPAASDTSAKVVVAGVGFQTPESVLHDATADVYLVTNINGEPVAKDDNGFISRVSPAGEVVALRWIDGAAEAVTLHAPKGMALRGDSLFVSDIDSVRVFHRETGEPLGGMGVPGASMLNDLATGPDGTLYATDTGVRFGAGGPEPTGTDALYRFENGRAVAVAKGEQLGRPNGVDVDANGAVVVTFGSGKILRVAPDGTVTEVATPPTGQLDGVVLLADGGLLVTSWEGKTTYHMTPQGEFHSVWPDFESPADLGFDKRRSRMLIPSFMGNRVEFARTH